MKNVIIDCDPGMDDSMAIVMAYKSKDLDVKAIISVNGNYPADIGAANARKVLEMIGRTDIPAAQGMETPMVRAVPSDPFTHGKDGQAENYLPDPVMPLSEKHGVDLMIDTIRENAGDIYIVSTAPMTNIAMALRKAPEIKEMICGIYAISGAFGLNEYAYKNATGDTPQSEWNVYVDPDAADIVYRSGIPLTALGLDVATHFDVNLSEEDERKLKESENPEAAFLYNAIRFVNSRGFEAYCAVIDCMAVGYAIDESLVEIIRGKVGVETKGELSLGNTVLDRRHHHVWEDLPEISIGYRADYRRFLQMLMELVLA